MLMGSGYFRNTLVYGMSLFPNSSVLIRSLFLFLILVNHTIDFLKPPCSTKNSPQKVTSSMTSYYTLFCLILHLFKASNHHKLRYLLHLSTHRYAKLLNLPLTLGKILMTSSVMSYYAFLFLFSHFYTINSILFNKLKCFFIILH